MSTKKDNSLILNEIKSHYNFKKDSHFANFLGIAPTTLSSWHTRQSFDYDLVYAKCEAIDGNWLLTGKGAMLKDDRDLPILEDPQEPYEISPAQTIKDLRETIKAQRKTIETLELMLENNKQGAKRFSDTDTPGV